MATKKFTAHAQRVLNHNPNVEKCTESKIFFREEFALKVCEALKNGEDPYQVFQDNGFSIRILGKSRINGILGLWKSKYNLENLPRRQVKKAEPKVVETAKDRREKNLALAIAEIDRLVAHPEELSLEGNVSHDLVRFHAIKRVYETKEKVVVKDVVAHYVYQYPQYYAFLQSLKPKSEFVNPLNPHQKRKDK